MHDSMKKCHRRLTEAKMEDLWDDDDDDDILQLVDRPPMSQVALPTKVAVPKNDDLLKAKGEVGILRQKLSMLEKTVKEHDESQKKLQFDLKTSHAEEVEKLKVELERLEDERKFMLLEQRHLFTPRNSSKSTSSHGNDTAEPSPMEAKRRKMEPAKQYVPLAQNLNVDDGSLFFDHLVSYKLLGAEHTVLESLDHICNYETDLILSPDIEIIKARSPLGPTLRALIFKWKSIYSLDQLVDKTLEILAIAIKSVSDLPENRLAIPFLLSLMHCTINFRHSATSISSLKDVFQFVTDFIITDPSFLKQTLHENPLELDVSPDVFQYSMLDQLCMTYSFDVLETCVVIMLTCNPEEQAILLNDDTIAENLVKCCNLALSISYKPVLPIIINTTEILLGVVELEPKESIWENKWLTLFPKLIQNWSRPIIFDSEKINFAGLNRCCGNNANHVKLNSILDFSDIRYLPMIIENEFEHLSFTALENQEDQTNDVKRQQLLSALLRLIYFCWVSISDDYKRSLRLDELTICLWRIVYGSSESTSELSTEWAALVNPLKTLALDEERKCLDDAYDEENLPAFMHLEEKDIKRESAVSKFTINDSWAFKEMAKYILESITTMDEADSLYVAMVSDI
ncbi:unnamed protein product [Kluyveromyces dobzhanskii CBS 2104]|uniref:WGS project CCBQ000000000 data, contig MAT n=1 Tax=Kluyveromyces dobzhanskii CBS 2104 TaxID=1427455 RepID=A0A0A8L1N4_9SACH|nr:unnamed protein product [Kluyveromyces dobzhanskii CBS 2104]